MFVCVGGVDVLCGNICALQRRLCTACLVLRFFTFRYSETNHQLREKTEADTYLVPEYVTPAAKSASADTGDVTSSESTPRPRANSRTSSLRNRKVVSATNPLSSPGTELDVPVPEPVVLPPPNAAETDDNWIIGKTFKKYPDNVTLLDFFMFTCVPCCGSTQYLILLDLMGMLGELLL